MEQQEAFRFAEAVQAKVKDTGGWKGSWASRKGLKRAMVSNWKARMNVPRYWRLALKASLKDLNSV